jgi:Domain of unknown function (DUF4160)
MPYILDVPAISRFFGVVIQMFFREHGVPHFHAVYGEHRGSFAIAILEMLEGELPRRVRGFVLEWASDHRAELAANWERARANTALLPIAPLEE